MKIFRVFTGWSKFSVPGSPPSAANGQAGAAANGRSRCLDGPLYYTTSMTSLKYFPLRPTMRAMARTLMSSVAILASP